MAIYATSQSAAYGTKFGQGVARTPIVLTAIVAVATGMIDNANDEVGLFWVPKGLVVTGINFTVTDMDTSTGLLFDVGDDGSEARLLAAVSGQAAATFVTLASTGLLYKYTAPTLVKAYVNTAATTGAAGTIKALLHGFIDENYDTTPLVAA